MLLHIIFVLSGLIQKQKRIQNYIESGFRKFGKEKEKDLSTLWLLACWPSCLAPLPRRPAPSSLSASPLGLTHLSLTQASGPIRWHAPSPGLRLFPSFPH
jgi:hypothetical protein